MKEPGYVYILTNPSFKDDIVKIGKTSCTVEKRMRELQTTGVPTPFEKYASIKTKKYQEVERFMHHCLEGCRVNNNREFFSISREKAFSFMQEIADLLDDAEITACTEQARKDQAEIIRKRIYTGKDDWVASTTFTGIAPEEASRFIDQLLQLGYGAHVGTCDYTIDRSVGKKRFNVLMLFGNGLTVAFQPKSLVALSVAATGAQDAASNLLESLKSFLGSYQTNKTPYEPLAGYYYIQWSTIKKRGNELIEVMRMFISEIG